MKIILMVGNVGSGKSTYARRLAEDKNTIIVNMDDIQAMLHGRYNAYDPNLKPLYYAMEECVLYNAKLRDCDVVVDRTSMDRKTRARFVELARKLGVEIEAHVMAETNKDILVCRRMNSDSRGISQDKWRDVIDRLEASYEEPTPSEGFKTIAYVPEVDPSANDDE